MIHPMRRQLLAKAAIGWLAPPAVAENWPAWRGADGQGHSSEKGLPVTWSQTENVRWKVPLPDAGNSTPVIWNDRIFVLKTGNEVWHGQVTERTANGAWGSMVHADGRLYVTNRDGTTLVFAASPVRYLIGRDSARSPTSKPLFKERRTLSTL